MIAWQPIRRRFRIPPPFGRLFAIAFFAGAFAGLAFHLLTGA